MHAEHNVSINSDFRSARFDIYANDEIQVNYNVESQIKDEHNLPKRSRFYQSELDAYSLKPSADFNELKPSYVIFICTFDPFGDGLYRYSFRQRCDENGRELGDEAYRIFLSTKGENEKDVPIELVHFLRYMEHSTDEYVEETKDEAITKLHDRVTNLKKWRTLEAQYMTVEEWARGREKDAANEGRAEGIQAHVSMLCEFLKELGEIPESLLEKVSAEKDFATLSRWVMLAAKVSSIEEFIEKMY